MKRQNALPIAVQIALLIMLFFCVYQSIESFQARIGDRLEAPKLPECRPDGKQYNTPLACQINERQRCRSCGDDDPTSTYEYDQGPAYNAVHWL